MAGKITKAPQKTKEKTTPEKKESKSLSEPQTKVTAKASTAPAPKKVKADRPASAVSAKVARCAGKSCQIKDCKRSYRAKGYCKFHYGEWRHGKFGSKRYKACADKNCKLPMANNRHGFCEAHYQNYYVKGIEEAKEEAPAKPVAKPAAPVAAAG